MSEYSLEQAKILYEEGNLAEAQKHCFMVQKAEGEDAPEAHMLYAKITLAKADGIPTPEDEVSTSYANSIFLAFSDVKTVSQLKQLLAQMNEDLFSLTYEKQRGIIAQWSEDLGNTSYATRILEQHMNALRLKLRATMKFNMCKGFWNALGKEKGMTDEEISTSMAASFNMLSASAKLATTGQFTTTEKSMVAEFLSKNQNHEEEHFYRNKISEDLRDTAKTICQATLDDIVENNVVPGQYVAARSQEWSQGLLTPELMMDAAVATLDKSQKEERLAMLGEKAIMQTNVLNATYVVNGKLLFVLRDQLRTKRIDALKKTYDSIKELKPDFVAPELPQSNTSSASNSQKGGCYVATCVYGSYDCPQVWTLRRYRDYTLAKTWYGRSFIRAYYAISPTLVKWFGHTEWFKKMWKPQLDNMVRKLNTNGFENTPYLDKHW